MSAFEKVQQLIVGKTTFPVSQYLMNRKRILRNYTEMIKMEFLPQEILQGIQLSKLQAIVAYANEFIPYYQNQFKEIGLHPGDIQSLDDIKGIPVLGRQDVIAHHKEMVDYRYRKFIGAADSSQRGPGAPLPLAVIRKNKLIRNTSSGSTGAPTIFYEDGSRSAMNWSYEMRLKNWYGLMPGVREARFVRVSTDFTLKSLSNIVRKLLWGQLLLPGVNLAGENYEQCIMEILKFKPRVLWGFTSALAGLADHIVRNRVNLGCYKPELAIGWAAPVYDHEEKVIKEAFNCKVSNIYGSREVGHIAGKCPYGSFHINQENLLIESVSAGDDVPGIEEREILATNLDMVLMPFIRYRMGDLASVIDSKCGCGRTLQVLDDLLGRTGEVFITKGGRMISPNFWCRTFMSGKISGAVKRFQIIYTKDKDIKIKLEKDKGYSDDTENYIREMIRKNFTSTTELTLEFVAKIEPEISGKYLMVVNEKID